MGSSQSSTGGKAQESTDKIIEKINNFSSNYGSHDPDRVTLQGMNRYLNQKEERALDQKVGSSPIERKMRYDDIANLATTIGMGDEAKFKLLSSAYTSLNTQAKYLEKANVERPSQAPQVQTPSVVPSERGNAHQHPRELAESAVNLALNPHSYSSLSGKTANDLLALDSRTLTAVVHADQTFLDKTANHWTLPDHQRAGTAQNINTNYDRQLGVQLGLVGQTNATPQIAFENGKDAAIRAVNLGLDIYGGPNQSVLKAFGQAALSINLATEPSQTLAGRGANTISEQTMSHNPDGHSQGGARKY